MKVLVHLLILGATLTLCRCAAVVEKPERGPRFCAEICSACGGPSFTENNICYCYIEKDVDMEKCMHSAWKKSNLFSMEWRPIHAPGRIARKVRPVRGSFLDPIVANVFEKNLPNINNEILFKENALLKGPIQRLFKRSIKKDLHAQDFNLFDLAEKMDSERKKRVPRSLEPPKKKFKNLNEASEKLSNEIIITDSNNLVREKRNLAQFASFPQFGMNTQGNMYELILQYPTVDDEEKIQVLFPNTNGLDISHELYYEGSDEIDDDDYNDDLSDSTWNRRDNSYNPFQSLYTRRQVYSNDPYLRNMQSSYWMPNSEQNMFPYGPTYYAHI